MLSNNERRRREFCEICFEGLTPDNIYNVYALCVCSCQHEHGHFENKFYLQEMIPMLRECDLRVLSVGATIQDDIHTSAPSGGDE